MSKKLLITAVIALSMLLPACTDADTAVRVAEGQGYTDVKTTGYRWTGCGEHDSYRTGFTALDQRGRYVSGVVCSQWGLFGKSNTVRID